MTNAKPNGKKTGWAVRIWVQYPTTGCVVERPAKHFATRAEADHFAMFGNARRAEVVEVLT